MTPEQGKRLGEAVTTMTATALHRGDQVLSVDVREMADGSGHWAVLLTSWNPIDDEKTERCEVTRDGEALAVEDVLTGFNR